MTVVKKLSRRDAIKLLGAATGATLLANLPSKWSTPQLASGVLPAHAQTSACYSVQLILAAGGNGNLTITSGAFPDELSGVFLGWYCPQTGCFRWTISAINPGPGLSGQIVTISQTFNFNLAAGASVQVLIDPVTGDIGTNGSPSQVGGCTWGVGGASIEGGEGVEYQIGDE